MRPGGRADLRVGRMLRTQRLRAGTLASAGAIIVLGSCARIDRPPDFPVAAVDSLAMIALSEGPIAGLSISELPRAPWADTPCGDTWVDRTLWS